jgi:hypothetical protein
MLNSEISLILILYTNFVHQNAPFFGNTRDNTHCFQACMRMVLKYYLPKKNFTWKELEKLSAKKKGKWTWSTQMLLNLKKMGFDVVTMDTFDIDAFIERGGEFLIEAWGKEVGEAQIKHSDIAQERRLFKKLKKEIVTERYAPTMSDIRMLLKKGYLVKCTVNSSALNKRKGYAGHGVLVYGIDKSHVYLHDPGLPPHPHRKVTRALFKKAWMYPQDGDQALVAMRLQA